MSLMDLCKQFGANVRRIRRAKDISQEALAHEAGLNRTYLSEIERSGGNPTLKVVERLATALNVSASSLME